jgi:hypothetical protein
LYRNGEFVKSNSGLSIDYASAGDLYIGEMSNGFPFAGKLSKERFLTGDLTAEEISQIYTSQKQYYGK